MIYMKSKDAPNFNHILDLSSTYLQRIPIGNDSDALVGVVTGQLFIPYHANNHLEISFTIPLMV